VADLDTGKLSGMLAVGAYQPESLRTGMDAVGAGVALPSHARIARTAMAARRELGLGMEAPENSR